MTTTFDNDIGQIENLTKRQIWGPLAAQSVEHLGTTAAPLQPTTPLKPRYDYAKAYGLCSQIPRLPGGYCRRIQATISYVRPQFTWAAPLHSQPPSDLANTVFQCVTNSRSTWWCKNRFWCDHLVVHPQYASSAQALRAVPPLKYLGEHLQHSVQQHLDYFGLSWYLTSVDHGIAATLPNDCDASLDNDIANANHKLPEDQQLPPRTFWTASNFGQHLLRHIQRRRLLQAIPATRHDSHGKNDVDVTAQSNSKWTSWRNSLSNHEKQLLLFWRCGAIRTPSRRWPYNDERTKCPYCHEPNASARHFFADCPRLREARRTIQAAHNLPHDFFFRQPRITAKSGWITTSAADTTARRAELQVAACKMGIAILTTLG